MRMSEPRFIRTTGVTVSGNAVRIHSDHNLFGVICKNWTQWPDLHRFDQSHVDLRCIPLNNGDGSALEFRFADHRVVPVSVALTFYQKLIVEALRASKIK